ncbi:MAG: SGNH/GDSL hydrolase family protein [Clostridiales bacterium]|nr:MAG: SGNH/GDSL hydrolase family protein [Clostridiales bacterium]
MRVRLWRAKYPKWTSILRRELKKWTKNADAVVVFGGTNDFGHGDAPIGSFDDRTPDTFYGACHDLFTRLVEKFSDVPIVVVTPLHRTNEDNPRGDGNKAYNYGVLKDYVDIIFGGCKILFSARL